MSETKVRGDNFFVTYGWMLNRLNLKGVALQIFSIIYGFSQDGEGSFTGSLQYLMDFTNCSKNTILKALKELIENDYVKKTENTINGVRFCTYKVNAPLVQNLNSGGSVIEPGSGSKIASPPGAETDPNNKDLYNKSLIDKEKTKEVVDLYNTICISYPKVKVISGKREKETLARLETYSLEDIGTVFANAENSSFMKGKNDRGWSANFDWMMDENNFIKILEGNYADKDRREISRCMQQLLGEAELEAIQRVLQEDIPAEEWTSES